MNFGQSTVTHDLRGQMWLKTRSATWSCNPTDGQSRDGAGRGHPPIPCSVTSSGATDILAASWRVLAVCRHSGTFGAEAVDTTHARMHGHLCLTS